VTTSRRLRGAAALCLRVVLFGWGLVLLSFTIAELAVPANVLYSEARMPPSWWLRAQLAAWTATFGALLVVSPPTLAQHPRWLAAGAAIVLVWPLLQFARDGRGPRDALGLVFFFGPLALQALLVARARRAAALSAPPPRPRP
jgi:hypothetical protein